LIDETIWQQLLDIARQCEQPHGFEPSRRGKRWLRKGELSKIAAFPFRAPTELKIGKARAPGLLGPA